MTGFLPDGTGSLGLKTASSSLTLAGRVTAYIITCRRSCGGDEDAETESIQ
jgi:hypothetical protein